MQKHIYDETNGLWYELHGDYYLPMLTLAEEEPATYGKYGMLRRTYLQEYKPAQYQLMLLQGRLTAHLNQIDREAREQMEILVLQMAKKQGITESLKAENPMKWVGMMNNIRNAAEEIVLKETVYV